MSLKHSSRRSLHSPLFVKAGKAKRRFERIRESPAHLALGRLIGLMPHDSDVGQLVLNDMANLYPTLAVQRTIAHRSCATLLK